MNHIRMTRQNERGAELVAKISTPWPLPKHTLNKIRELIAETIFADPKEIDIEARD